MPGWYEATKALRDAGRLRIVGVIQEQHPDRCGLFLQWKRMEFPILVDALNLTDARVVPTVTLLDEHGVVRAVRPKPEEVAALCARGFPEPEVETPAMPWMRPLDELRRDAADDPAARRALGAALFLREDALEPALAAWEGVLRDDPDDARAHFRLGVALRRRHESPDRRPGDFARAVEHWTAALRLDPGQYIRRRRIQQYGPRLDKPYPFYSWIAAARADIEQRGETPRPLAVEPRGTELAGKGVDPVPAGVPNHPDLQRRVEEAGDDLVLVDAAVAPAAVEPGRAVRVHLLLRPAPGAHWNNEAEPLRGWLTVPEGWSADSTIREAPPGAGATSDEERILEFEVTAPPDADAGTAVLHLDAWFNVCRDADGTCLFRRVAVSVPVPVRELP